MKRAKSKIERRLNQKLFLKGERDYSPKSAMVRRPYPPGAHGQKRRRRRISGYGQQLAEKQKLRYMYHLSAKKLARYVKESLAKRQNAQRQEGQITDRILRRLESRLDSVVFRLGFASSRSTAHHLVSHGHFFVNRRRVDLPGYEVKKGDTISIRPESLKSKPFYHLEEHLKKYHPPSWFSLDAKELTGQITGEPVAEEVILPVDMAMVIEYYSR